MRRADLMILSDDDLIAASNKLTFKRAEREWAVGEPAAELRWQGDALTVMWSDGVCCEFPEDGGLSRATCTCPARQTCVHRVRAIFALRQALQDDAASSPAPPAPAFTPADFDENTMRGTVGDAGFETVLQLFQDGLQVEKASTTEALLPDFGVRVRFVPGGVFAVSHCSCGARDCLHRVAAALAYRDALPAMTLPEVPGALARIRSVVEDLAAVGRDSLPTAATDALAALATVARGESMAALTRDLRQLADLARAFQRRDVRFDGRRWLFAMMRLAARVEGLYARDPATWAFFAGTRGAARMDAAPIMLTGVGAAGRSGARGHVVTLYLVRHDTGRLVEVTVGRGADAQLAQVFSGAPVWGAAAAQALIGQTFSLHQARLSADGTFAPDTKARIARTADAMPAPDDAIFSRLRARSTAEIAAQFHERYGVPAAVQGRAWLDGADGSRTLILALRPGQTWAPQFDRARQRLAVPVRLASGDLIGLEVDYRPDTAQLIEIMEQLPTWESPPTHILARVWPSAGGFRAHPIAAWAENGEYFGALGLGTALPTSGRLSALSPAVTQIEFADRFDIAQSFDDPQAAILDQTLTHLQSLLLAGLDQPQAHLIAQRAGLIDQLRAHDLHAGAALLVALTRPDAAPEPRSPLRPDLAHALHAFAWTVEALRARTLRASHTN